MNTENSNIHPSLNSNPAPQNKVPQAAPESPVAIAPVKTSTVLSFKDLPFIPFEDHSDSQADFSLVRSMDEKEHSVEFTVALPSGMEITIKESLRILHIVWHDGEVTGARMVSRTVKTRTANEKRAA